MIHDNILVVVNTDVSMALTIVESTAVSIVVSIAAGITAVAAVSMVVK